VNNTYTMTVHENIDQVIKRLASYSIQSMTVETYSLEELFLAMYGDQEEPGEHGGHAGGGDR
jgi:hypothetical protein